VAVTVMRLLPGSSGISAEKFPLESRRAVVPRTVTCLMPESSRAWPRTVILGEAELVPMPLETGGEVMTIFGGVVSLTGGLAGTVAAGLLPGVFGLLPSVVTEDI
jgi:hypothetical protein